MRSTSIACFEAHEESVELWSPGNPLFKSPEVLTARKYPVKNETLKIILSRWCYIVIVVLWAITERIHNSYMEGNLMNDTDKQSPSSIELYDVNKLTPVGLLRLVKRFTIWSWIVLISSIITLTLSIFWIGWGYQDGSLPTVAYILHEGINSPLIAKKEKRRDDRI